MPFVQYNEAFKSSGSREMPQPCAMFAIPGSRYDLPLQFLTHTLFALGNEGHQYARIERALVSNRSVFVHQVNNLIHSFTRAYLLRRWYARALPRYAR
ncbi:hypothetical protein C9I56_41740 [Paraburkholderia caribensis]|uniref:Uncharacterized protein n=1 Tax=Paraburkholderia phymatum (strain DSM 17167 / CIP 108236 / LMG 21445 / STM815) TaxID=391038 RepID=B2JY72_PARP8|nr:hypothetical protein Bphy_7680 [Paraburkholderia phymatum STM815]PTB22964.1 hypothetical protein C9I56_41740 [Paraburkholderia caribensis]